MSVNYHAYMARGMLFTEYEKQCEQWRGLFSGYDPERICRLLGLERDEDGLYIDYLGSHYRLRLCDGILEKQTGSGYDDRLFFNESMSIYHHLYYAKEGAGQSGTWVPNESLDKRYQSRREDPLLSPFAKTFDGRLEELKKACIAAGGENISEGDLGYVFRPFEKIPMKLVFWEADEDFPAQANLYVDSRVGEYIHFETTGCMVSDLLERLEELAENTGR